MVDQVGVEPTSRMPYFKACTTILYLRFLAPRLAMVFNDFGRGGFLPFRIWLTLRGLGILFPLLRSSHSCFTDTFFCYWACHYDYLL
jgi:hypothetical protein